MSAGKRAFGLSGRREARNDFLSCKFVHEKGSEFCAKAKKKSEFVLMSRRPFTKTNIPKSRLQIMVSRRSCVREGLFLFFCPTKARRWCEGKQDIMSGRLI